MKNKFIWIAIVWISVFIIGEVVGAITGMCVGLSFSTSVSRGAEATIGPLCIGALFSTGCAIIEDWWREKP